MYPYLFAGSTDPGWRSVINHMLVAIRLHEAGHDLKTLRAVKRVADQPAGSRRCITDIYWTGNSRSDRVMRLSSSGFAAATQVSCSQRSLDCRFTFPMAQHAGRSLSRLALKHIVLSSLYIPYISRGNW
jgi:hypothetical protein